MDELKATFFVESEDLLAAMGDGLEAMANRQTDAGTVNAVFRAVHSIKGAAGAFGLSDVVAFAHSFETVLDAIRSDRLVPDGEVLHVLQRSGDLLADLLEIAREGRGDSPEGLAALLDSLEGLATEEDLGDFVFEPLGLGPLVLGEEARPDVRRTYEIQLRPGRQFYHNGHEPANLLAALAELGDLSVSCDASGLPALADLDHEDGHLAWAMRLATDASEAEVHDVFGFVEDLCDLSIAAAASEEGEPVAEAASGPAPIDLVPLSPIETAPTVLADPGPARPAEGPPPAPAAEPPRPTIRVDLDRVDRLINWVGELIVTQAVLGQKAAEAGLPLSSPLASQVEDLGRLAREIQEGVMSIRAQPVKPLFQRMARVVREAAQATGKQVEIVTVGEDTEVDKSVVEGLVDPLTHMIRNAIDHGIEAVPDRIAKGKPAAGRVTLSACHVSGTVRIVLRDDGAGLDRERILATAIRKGLIPEGSVLSEGEIDNLLFLPGFSTAASVTSLSGRGVGMDVARTAIAALGGRIGIASRPGEGTTFTISLPLTLAVLDGLLVSVAGQDMVLPVSTVVETLRPSARNTVRLGADSQAVEFHGLHVPILDLAPMLGFGPGLDINDAMMVIVRTSSDSLLALVVEAISDKRQVVIKSLRGNVGSVAGISAATILGDGRIALILEPDALADLRLRSGGGASSASLEVSHA